MIMIKNINLKTLIILFIVLEIKTKSTFETNYAILNYDLP